MIRRYHIALFRAAILLVIFLPVSVWAQGEEDKFEIKDCRGRPAGICLKGECAWEKFVHGPRKMFTSGRESNRLARLSRHIRWF